jgi:hypothetical protein
MPKNEIDYSKTIIYKIYCKDDSIKDLYIGHTTNFIKRKYQHKISSKNDSNKLNIYKFIREYGGWENWDMVEIAIYNCKNSEEARIKEQHHYEMQKSLLNSSSNYLENEQYFCSKCNTHCLSSKNYDIHIKTEKHLNMSPKNQPKRVTNSASKYFCKYCDYRTYKKCNYDTHNISAKHTKNINDYKMRQNSAKNQPKISQNLTQEKFICSCGKEYQHRQGLWKHKQKCELKEDYESEYEGEQNSVEPSDKEIIMMLIKDNNEFKNMMMKVLENGTHNTNTTNTTNTNSHNKAFNLNFFLNETCKDAMNIMDFVDSIKLQLSDLENVGKLGYVEGISNIIVKNLKELDISKRPVHCADKKREVVYIKDDNKWEKEDSNKKKIRKAIKRVVFKNQRLIPSFKEAHPDCLKSASNFSDQYNKIIVESMGGSGDNDTEKEDKIIRNISKHVIIDK